jgi:hypothetical protein
MKAGARWQWRDEADLKLQGPVGDLIGKDGDDASVDHAWEAGVGRGGAEEAHGLIVLRVVIEAQAEAGGVVGGAPEAHEALVSAVVVRDLTQPFGLWCGCGRCGGTASSIPTLAPCLLLAPPPQILFIFIFRFGSGNYHGAALGAGRALASGMSAPQRAEWHTSCSLGWCSAPSLCCKTKQKTPRCRF